MDDFISKEEFFVIVADEFSTFQQLIFSQIEETEKDGTQVFIGVVPATIRGEDGDEYKGFFLLFEEVEKTTYHWNCWLVRFSVLLALFFIFFK